MTDKLKKFLAKLPNDQLAYLQPYLERIQQNQLEGLNIKPLKGHKHVYGLRVGKYRIIFQHEPNQTAQILVLGKRDDQTYRGL